MSYTQTKHNRWFWRSLNKHIDELANNPGDISKELRELPAQWQEVVLNQRKPLVMKMLIEECRYNIDEFTQPNVLILNTLNYYP